MADPYTRISLQGTLPSGEVWSINPAFIGNFDTSPPTTDDLQEWAEDVAALSVAATYIGNLKNLLSENTALTNVRAALYDDEGHLAAYADAPVAGFTGTGEQTAPSTTAVALSLYSAVAGRSTRGRLFVPALAIPLDGDTGRIPIASCSLFAGEMASWMTAIQDSSPASWEAVLGVWSKKLGTGIQVTSIRCGDVPDSMRRRKDALDEARAIWAYPIV